MLNTRCRIERKETMTEKTNRRHAIWREADGIQMDLRALEARFVRLRSMLANLNLPDVALPNASKSVARNGLSPRELHPDACPHCELAAGHTQDCPTLNPLEPLDIGATK